MTDMAATMTLRYRRPLNQSLSHQTPYYYCQLSQLKPIFAWTMDDVLEQQLHPANPAVASAVDFLSRLSEPEAKRFDQMVDRQVRGHMPLITQALTCFEDKMYAILEMLHEGFVRLSPEHIAEARPHPLPDQNRFPVWTNDDHYTVLYKPVWQYGLRDLLLRKLDPDRSAVERFTGYLAQYASSEMVAFDRLVDTVAEGCDDRLADVLADLSTRVCSRLMSEAVAE